MTDGIVQIPPDSSGKKIDTSELTVNSQTVERQRIVVADPTNASNLAGVTIDGAVLVDAPNTIQCEILMQLKRIALLLEIYTGQEVSVDDVA